MFKNLNELWADTIINYRIFWVFVLLLALSISAFLFIKLPPKHDNSFEMFMLKDDPNIVIFENFRDLFGDAEYLSIGISARSTDQDLFVAETIKVIDEISSMLESHEFVTKVSSLSNYQYTHGENGILRTDNLFEEPSSIKKNSLDLITARDIMTEESLAHDRLITKDLQHTRILARTEYIKNENFHKVRISNDIYDFLERKDYFSKGYHIRLGGSAIIAERFEFLSKRDTSILNPVVASIMSLIIYNLFGSLFFCFLPWLLIGTSVLLVSGLQSWLEYPMTIVNAALIPTLMIIGMAVSVHVLSEFVSLRKDGNVPQSAAKKVIKNLLRPIFFTAFTTSLGFGALAVTALVPLRQYALLAGAGSIIIFFVAMTFFVSLLSFVKVIPGNNTELKFNNLIDRVTQALVKFTFNYRKIIVVFAVIGVIFCGVTLPKITVDSNIFNYFKSNSWINVDMEYFDELYKFGGIEVIVDSGKVDGIKHPKFLKMVDLMGKRLNGYEKTGKVYSTIELLKQLRQTLNANDESFFILPDSSEMTAQLLLMYENSGPDEDLSDLIDFDNRYLRLTIPINNLSAKDFADYYQFIRDDLAKEFPTLSLNYTGPMVLNNAQENYINMGLKKSFALALSMIGVSFVVLFKSIKYGVISLFPSVLPILIVGGATVLMGLSLDLGTVVVGAMCMGIAVDDAIHVMARYTSYKKKGYDTHQSIELAVKHSGRAVIFTSLILVFGFSAMLFASLIPTILFGVFVALIMTLALLGDLLVLPALLFIFEKK